MLKPGLRVDSGVAAPDVRIDAMGERTLHNAVHIFQSLVSFHCKKTASSVACQTPTKNGIGLGLRLPVGPQVRPSGRSGW